MPDLNSFEKPIPLSKITTPTFPDDVFPLEIDIFIKEISLSTETPIDLPAMMLLSAIATASQDKYVVQVKQDYIEPINIWVAVALPPGSRKTAIQNAIMKPIQLYEAELSSKIKPIIAEKTSKNKSLEFRIKEMRVKAAKAKDAKEFDKVQDEILELENQLEEPPKVRQLWTSDITPESLGNLMAENNGYASICSDEAGIFDILAGRYSGGIPNLDLFLKSHSGAPTRINRVGRSPDFIERSVLTMGITPQPEVLKSLAKTQAFKNRGLLGRFLYSFPFSNLGNRNLDTPPMNGDTLKVYNELIKAILNQEKASESIYHLCLSKEAYEAWLSYSKLIEIKMSDDGPFQFMRDWAGKFPGQIARISALLHIMKYAHLQPQSQLISESEMKAAIKIANYLSEHAIAAFDLMGTDPNIDGARKVLSWIEKKRYSQFSFRDCHCENKNRFKKKKDLEPAIDILIENYYLQESPPEKKNCRPSRIFVVNPHVLDLED